MYIETLVSGASAASHGGTGSLTQKLTWDRSTQQLSHSPLPGGETHRRAMGLYFAISFISW